MSLVKWYPEIVLNNGSNESERDRRAKPMGGKKRRRRRLLSEDGSHSQMHGLEKQSMQERLETLSAPLQNGGVTVSKVFISFVFPLLVAAKAH